MSPPDAIPPDRVLAELQIAGDWQAARNRVARQEAVRALAAADEQTVADDALQAAIDAFRAERGLDRADVTLAWLAARGLSLEQVEAHCEVALLEAQLLAAIPAEQVHASFAELRPQLERARLAVIETGDEDLALELRQQIVEDGLPLARLARQHSLHASRDLGGELGWRRRRQLDAAVAAKVFAAARGDVVGPFPAGRRVQLLQVQALREAALDEPTVAELRAGLLAQRIHRQLAGTAPPA